MFDIGFWEISLIFIIALIVVGPERIPALAKTAGKYIGKLKSFVNNVKSDVESEFDIDNIKKQLQLDEVKEQNIIDIIKDPIEDIKKSVKK